ncbi:MAG: hypothetical protein PWP23_2339 [Candidatus Sumerlaeota bacterium]|nr:hypothetical protein [Candidatus Sumerlaeota bacterium]
MRHTLCGLMASALLVGSAAAGPLTIQIDTKRIAMITENRRNPGEIGPLALGDVNGDGYDDLIMGAPRASSFTTVESGGVYVRFAGDFLFNSQVGTDDGGLYYDMTTPPDISTNRISTAVVVEDVFGRVPSGVQFIPERGGEAFGSAVASGDFDGDGFMDLAISAPAPFGSRIGAVYLAYGRADIGGIREIDLEIFDGFAFEISGREAGARFGEALLMADVDNDGYDDIIIGTPRHSSGGIVDVVYGTPGRGLSRTTIDALPTAHTRIVTDTTEEYFGAALAAGKINGDSFLELVIGAPRWPNASASRGRAVALNLAGTRPATIDLAVASPYFVVQEIGNQAGLGASLAIGDIDGDTIPDLAVGAPLKNSGAGGTNVGVVYILSDPASSAGTVLSCPGDHRTSIVGINNSEFFGSTLAMVRYDKVVGEELIVAAPGSNNVQENATEAGAVYVYRTGTVPPGDLFSEDLSIPWTKLTTTKAGFRLGTHIAAGQFDRQNELDLFISGDGDQPFRPYCGSDDQSDYLQCHATREGLRVFGVLARSVDQPDAGLAAKPGWMMLE